ncbi:MAG: DNA gyrase subunit A [Verrucomicrobiaceae bacterium]|nr:MAG: DNA gyrase subunit A [Verrucomicrobiaceae bacterium]
MAKSFLDYSMSVIISRALPDVRDGLKPSQRRILFAMDNLGIYPGKKHIKCAKICGDTSGNYHPHGEAVIYPTLVNMAQHWGIREILVDGQGNFGSVDGDPPAAMRYTEARLTHLGGLLMEDMDKDTVDFVPNYDERLTEPVVFPSAFPNLLVNGGTGIAVGMATNIPPHNLGEMVDGICAQIDQPDISIRELMRHIKGPDFPTGCTIYGQSGIHSYMHTGRGSVKVRGRVGIEQDDRGKDQIVITEIPYVVNRATLIKRIAELVTEKIIPEISGLRDECDENTRIVLELKRDARPQVVINNLYKHTALESSFSVNMLAIDNRRPRLLNLKDAIACYIEHRREVVLRRTRFLLRKAEARAEILEALLLATSKIDDFIRIIRQSANRDAAESAIRVYPFTVEAAEAVGVIIRGQPHVVDGRYRFSERQVKAIVELQLYKLTGLERDKIKAEYDEVMSEISDLMDILARESRVLTIIKDELLAIKAKHATPRLTDFAAEEGEINVVDLIANEGMIITISHRGYIKRTLVSEFRSQRRGGKGLKGMETTKGNSGGNGEEPEAGDFVEHLFTASAHDWLMFFTNTGRVYAERVYLIPEGSRTAKGRSIKNLLNLRPEEKVASVLRIPTLGESDKDATWDPGKFVIFATRQGVVKRTNLGEFRNIRKDGIIAIGIREGDDLIGCALTEGRDDIMLVTRTGMSTRFKEYAEVRGDSGAGVSAGDADEAEADADTAGTDAEAEADAETDTGGDEGAAKEKGGLRDMGRQATGVRGIKLKKGDEVVSLSIVDQAGTLLVASENGIGKRTPFDEYRITARGGKGIITMKTTGKTGEVVGALVVHETDEVMLMTTTGQSVRIPVSQIREAGRNTQGVKLITLRGEEKLQDIARVIAEPDEAGDAGDVAATEADTSPDSAESAADSAPDGES